jgi:hypothetical protein
MREVGRSKKVWDDIDAARLDLMARMVPMTTTKVH